MLEKNVSTNTDNGKSLEQLLNQLEAMRDALNAIEDKVDPAPRPYPDTFEMATFFASPFVKTGMEFAADIAAFKGKVDAYMMQCRKVWCAVPCKGNHVAWTKTWEHLERSFDDLCRASMTQLDSLAAYGKHVSHMAALACDCDTNAMERAMKDAG